MSDKPLLADEVAAKTKQMLQYLKNNKKDTTVMEEAMKITGVYLDYESLRDSK